MRRLMTLVAAGAAVLLQSDLVRAQRPLAISLAGGVSAPQGNLEDGADLGWHVLGALSLSSMMLPLGLRVDAAFNRFSGNDAVPSSLGSDAHHDVASLTGNLTYRLPMTGVPISPYLIGGMGAYRTSCNVGSDCAGSTAFGWNAGLGLKMYVLGFRSFIEARYHSTQRGTGSINFFPLTLGITF